MAEVTIMVGGRQYALHCRDGEEGRLHQLARIINDRVEKVRQSSRGLTEVRQLLFASILLADELSEAETRVASAQVPAPPEEDAAAMRALESLAERLEAVGEGLAADLRRA